MKLIGALLCLGLLTSFLFAGRDASRDWALPNFAQRLDLTVTNPGKVPVRTLVTLRVLSTDRIAPGFPGTLAIVMEVNPPGSKFPAAVVPSQADDLDGDGTPDEFEFPISLGPAESRQVEIYYSTTLTGAIVYPKETHASHSYGYNHQTAALESELIGYRTYGGFLLDVEAHRGQQGLYNDLIGFLAAHKNFAVGKDVFHVGDTLGLGGLFLRRNGRIYRPPFNVPDYAHKPSPEEVPHYRVVADGPIRSMIEAWMDGWTIGDDQVAIRARYSIDSREGFVRCRFQILPVNLNPGHTYEVGAGIRDLPGERRNDAPGRVELVGEQERNIGPLGLALYYDPTHAINGGNVATPESGNRVVIFNQRLEPGRAVSGSYAAAAAWSKSGVVEPLEFLAAEQRQVEARVEVSDERLEKTPQPQRINGEAY